MADETTNEEVTLYNKVAEAFGTEFDSEGEQSREDYKEEAVRFFNDMEDEVFNALPEDVTAWVNETADVMKANRGARRKKPLPDLEGLDVAEGESEEKPKGRRKRGEGKAEKEKAEPKGRDPENNRYFRVAEIMIANPDIKVEDLQKKVTASGHDYSEMTISRAHDAFTAVTGALKKHGKLKD